MKYLHAARELKTLIDEIDWTGLLPEEAGTPNISLRAFDYQAVVKTDGAGSASVSSDIAPLQGENNFITLSRLPSGEDINTNDGFTGISKQLVRICPFSIRRAQVTSMADAVHDKLNNYTGRPKKSTSTTLSAAITTGSRATATVSSTTGFLVGERIEIDDEEVTIAEITSSTAMKIDRIPVSGAYATLASGSVVRSTEGAQIDLCLLDDVGDIYEEESGFFGLDMFFVVVVSY